MADLTRPVNHIRPAKGWLNDPNGVCRVDGRWHVFFQHQPAGPRHHAIGWGHVSSDDLFTWQEHPLALAPRPGSLDASGCWSGCCTIDDGVPTFCYTAVETTAQDAVGAIATSVDGLMTWQAATEPSAPRIGSPTDDTRDPFVWFLDGRRYILQGHGGGESRAQVLVFDATDLTDWKLLGPFATLDDPVAAEAADADIWECPNLFHIDGSWVLLVSLWRRIDGEGVLSGVRWMVGDITVDGHPRFTARTAGVLDEGPAFYAPQGFDDDGLVLLWGWAWELGRSEQWLDDHGWAGMLTAPRELHVRDDRLVVSLAPEVLAHAGEVLAPEWSAAGASSVVVTTTESGLLTCSEVDGGISSVELAGPCTVLVDGSLVEVHGADNTHTTRIYPTAASWWTLSSGGDVEVRRLG